DAPAVRMKGNVVDGLGMAPQLAGALEPLCVPGPDGAFPTGDQRRPIRAVVHAGPRFGVARHQAERLTGRCIPEPDGAIAADRCQARAVGAERHAHGPALMTEQGKQLLRSPPVEDVYLLMVSAQ